jgi:subtilisin-like proprotein convertase family protein
MLTLALGARAGLVTQLFSPNTAIPEGDPSGIAANGNFTAAQPGDTVQSITIDLTVSGGYNGDLYAYLVAPNGTRTTLLDQPGSAVDGGFGNPQPGLNITLSDLAATSIQNIPDPAPADASSTLTGTYQAAQTLGNFGGTAANGTWSLFFADLGSGAGTPTLESYSLDLTVVPEPVNIALAIFPVGVLALTALRRLRRNSKPTLR